MNIELSDKEAAFLIKVLVQNHAEDEEDYDDPNRNNIGAASIGDFLLGKLSRNDIGHKLYYKVRQERFLREPVNQKVFMGAGYHSKVLINKLHRRLAFAFGQLSGAEQNGGMGYPFDEEMDQRANQNIKDVIRDILVAFSLIPEDLK